MSLEICLSFLVAFIISLILVPIVGKVTKKLGIIAHSNARTIHKGIIARTGGYGIYMSFLIAAMIFLNTDNQINAILLGGFVVFMVGFYDDIHDISPKMKLLGQIVAALIVIFYGGISLKGFTIPFLPETISYWIAIIITLGWIIGITNAVNLIDGLDGLCAGISIIVLITISFSSLAYGRTDIASLSLLLAGAIGGFLVYNFHPASIFLGDCGALFIGYMIAVISLLGFGYKSSTFFTLGAPIVVLAVPIMDTLIAIIRRRVHHKSFSEADKGHLHHKLMFSLELGQTKSVLILYAATALFSLCSYLYLHNKVLASILFLSLLLVFELFVEMTNMISRKYKPILTLVNVFIKSDKLPSIKETKPYKRVVKKIHTRYRYTIILVLVCAIVGGGCFYYYKKNQPKPRVETELTEYKLSSNSTELMKSLYNQLMLANKNNKKETLYEYIGAYFATDFFTLSNKTDDSIGGILYFYNDKKDDFITYAKDTYYKDIKKLIESKENTEEVSECTIINQGPSKISLAGLEDYSYYDVNVKLSFKEENPIIQSDEVYVVVTLIEKDHRFSVVSMDYSLTEK